MLMRIVKDIFHITSVKIFYAFVVGNVNTYEERFSREPAIFWINTIFIHKIYKFTLEFSRIYAQIFITFGSKFPSNKPPDVTKIASGGIEYRAVLLDKCINLSIKIIDVWWNRRIHCPEIRQRYNALMPIKQTLYKYGPRSTICHCHYEINTLYRIDGICQYTTFRLHFIRL